MGNVVQAGAGQAPARQSLIYAGLPESIPAVTVNKVCASGMKTVMFAAQSIAAGSGDTIVAGGFESMSNVPYYLTRARQGFGYGHAQAEDGIIRDGLWDVYNNVHMGNAGEVCAKQYNISREEQDDYAIESYTRAANAHANQAFSQELVQVEVPQKRGDPKLVSDDEEYHRVNFDKVRGLRPAFDKNGSVTAANASSINDGAAAMVVMSNSKARDLSLKPLCKIIGFADAAQAPVEFTTAPAKAIPLALKRAGISQDQVDFWEINEAFSVVALANMKLLGIPHENINVLGGAVSLGHPIGCSGARIVVTLAHLLRNKGAKYGCAAICNGGGGASAIVIENCSE